jgi:hypothetical protein
MEIDMVVARGGKEKCRQENDRVHDEDEQNEKLAGRRG